MSPGSSTEGSDRSSMTRAVPVASPGDPATPLSTSPTCTGVTSPSPRRFHVLSGGCGAVDDVGRVELVERQVVDSRARRACREGRGIDEEVVDLVGEQHVDLTRVGEVTALGHPPAELVEAHPHLVVAADVARLDPLAGRHPHGGGVARAVWNVPSASGSSANAASYLAISRCRSARRLGRRARGRRRRRPAGSPRSPAAASSAWSRSSAGRCPTRWDHGCRART